MSAGRHRPALRRGTELGTAHAPVDGRVLALVGGASLGGRLLRGLRHHGDRLLLRAAEPDPAGAGGQGGAAFGDASTWPAASSAPATTSTSPGTPTVALAWGSVFSALEVVPLTLVAYLGPRRSAARQAHHLGGALQVADLLLRRGRLLEHGGRRAVRFHDQPADRAVLHAGTEHDAAARPRRAVRRLRHAGHRPDAGLPAGAGSRMRSGRKAGSSSPSGR